MQRREEKGGRTSLTLGVILSWAGSSRAKQRDAFR